jgi:hypothetical protein
MWRWIVSTMMVDWLGLNIKFEQHAENSVLLCGDGKSLEIACRFLVADEINHPGPKKFPILPLAAWKCPKELRHLLPDDFENELPIVFGDNIFEVGESGKTKLGLDVFGSAFFMLSRYEEQASPQLDEHQRCSGSTSFTHLSGLLNRPIIDEYLKILVASMRTIWPSLIIEMIPGVTIVSCDVDEPFERWSRDPIYLLKGVAAALIRRRSISIARRRLLNGIFSQIGDFRYDPYWNFDWYMDACESHNKRAYFYFLARPGLRNVDAAYNLESKRMQGLLSRIHSRGHIIGLHGSYDSYSSAILLAAERKRLQEACDTAGVKQDIVHSRQHYLRWRADITPDCQVAAGLRFDSTVGFADQPGFRCGTSRSFKMWSWKEMTPLCIEQQPLVLMEATLISGVYLPRSESVVNTILEYKNRSLLFGGNFMFLWHNSSLTSESDRNLFRIAVQ